MKLVDLPLRELEVYRPVRVEPADFEAFWAATLADARSTHASATFTLVETGLRLIESYDVTFPGFGGQPVRGWLNLPRERSGPLPCVVEYIGYGGGRGFPIDWLVWASAGYAHLVMDTRGQGSVWRRGDTPDLDPDGSEPQYPGFMTRGIMDPRRYYYRRLITDAVRAVDAARAHPAVDAARVVVTGGSQGGGLALAAAGLHDGVAASMPDVPFLCHYRTATEIIETFPYQEINLYCRTHRDRVETVFANLAYFDGVNFAARATAPTLFSVGLMDDICPPRTVYAAYNHYNGPKDIRVYSYNNHEGGESFHTREKLAYLAQFWG